MNKIFFGFIGLLLLVFSQFTRADTAAGVFIEPMITYEDGDGGVNYPSPLGESDSDVTGLGTGARIGVHVFDIMFIGADGRYAWPTFKDSSLDQESRAQSWNYGPMVGFQMPTKIAIRVFGSYIMDGEMDPEKDGFVDSKFRNATGYRLGAGLRLGIASLNLEYQDLKYSETEAKTRLFTATTEDADLKTNSWIFSVSFPIGL